MKIVDQGKPEIARNVFRWVAAVKRPLNLDEIREAMAIKPCQQYMKSELLLNDISKITSWCRNLIVLDEEDQTIQFAHHSTMQFFLHSLSNPRLQAFHINVTDFDHHVGNICVTYLNFSDFERQLSKGATRKVEIESNDIAKAALLSNPDPAFARSILKLDKFLAVPVSAKIRHIKPIFLWQARSRRLESKGSDSICLSGLRAGVLACALIGVQPRNCNLEFVEKSSRERKFHGGKTVVYDRVDKSVEEHLPMDCGK